MGTKLEQLAIVQRTNLTNPNYYNLDWKLNNTINTYSLTHTRALSDNTTPVYGKGTGKFLDTVNGGGSLDINGNPINGGLGRLSSIQLNTANWSYSPATPYSVTNTRALSDNATPVYGKGTGIFLDTVNGGGSLDINGNPINGGVGRLGAFQINVTKWSYGPATPYSVINTRALSDNTTPVYGKGTGIFLDQNNGGGSLDINGNPINGGLGRLGSLLLNVFNKSLPYNVAHTRAVSDLLTPDNGKGHLNSPLLTSTNDYTLDAHFDIDGGSKTDRKGGGIAPNESGRENLLSVKQNYYFPDLTTITNFKTNKTNWYTLTHLNALAGNDEKGKGTSDLPLLTTNNNFILDTHHNIKGGNLTDRGENSLKSDSGRKNLLNAKTNIYFPDLTNNVNFKSDTTADVYRKLHPNALANNNAKGKGTDDKTVLDKNNNFILDAHHNFDGGNQTDRGYNIFKPDSGRRNLLSSQTNIYFPDFTSIPKFKDDKTANVYNINHPNAIGDTDDKGKGTKDSVLLATNNNFILDAHYNTQGGNLTDKGDNIFKPDSGRKNLLSNKTNIYFPDLTNNINFKSDKTANVYNINHPNAIGDTDDKGKGTKDSTLLTTTNNFTLDAHTNYGGGSQKDRDNRDKLTVLSKDNIYNYLTNIYDVFNPNALAGNDEKGKGTLSFYISLGVSFNNIGGGNQTDRGYNILKPNSGRKNLLTKNNKYYPSLISITEFTDESKGKWYKKPAIDAQGGTFAI
jgi:hypothetical protein